MLVGKTGTVVVNGVPFQYDTSGGLTLLLDPIVLTSVDVTAELRDGHGHLASATCTARTVEGGRFGPGTGSSHAPITPSLGDYLVAYQKHVGPWTEVDPERVADQGYRTDVASGGRVIGEGPG
jgi:hypothetical protein